MAKVKAIIRSIYALLFMMQIDLQLVTNANWPKVIKIKIVARHMTYSVVDVVPSSRSSE